jgi:hypothetical protein
MFVISNKVGGYYKRHEGARIAWVPLPEAKRFNEREAANNTANEVSALSNFELVVTPVRGK